MRGSTPLIISKFKSMKKIKFIASPLGFGLAYSEGEEGEFETSQADELIKNGLAVEEIEVEEKPKVEKAVKEIKAEKSVK